MHKALRPASPTRGQTPEARGTTVLQAVGPQKQKVRQMRQQWNMFQTKEQDKTPEEQLSGDRQSTQKVIQRNGSKDDPRSQKKNGGTDQENTRNKSCKT